MKENASKRVFVGLSGGVDSAVAAALLKNQGYDVAGVFMRFWKPRMDADFKTADGRGWENSCCSAESEAAARLVAGKLGIPFYVFNFEKDFKRAVVDYFLRELAHGRTPNPCVVCNPEIKFGLFLERAKKLGVDFVATGHYARLKHKSVILSEAKNLLKNDMGKRSFAIAQDDKGVLFKIFTPKDKQKDQSYFLYGLSQEQLRRVIFPLAGYTKAEVYKLAKQWRLPHQAHQSFDVCFAGDYQVFLRKNLKLKPGKIISISVIPAAEPESRFSGSRVTRLAEDGKSRREPGMTKEIILGTHQGLPLYTIGQRASVGGPGPFFVVKKDIKKNILYVSNNERDLYQKEMAVADVNWVSGKVSKLPLRCKIKIRYGGEAAEAVINKQLTINNKQQIGVKFRKSQRAVTPGQSAVFYGRGGEVLGGGFIG